MREYLSIVGGRRLEGNIAVSGAKNAALPLMMACIVSNDECVLRNVPNLEDISVTVRLLTALGGEAEFRNNTLRVNMKNVRFSEPPYNLVKLLRASFWGFGPLLARTGFCKMTLPGGDAIGTRPVDLHLQGLTRLGADIRMEHGVVIGRAPGGLRSGEIALEYPSVGATHHLLMTAALVPGQSVISGAAREPEVVELARFLRGMGAIIEGEGTDEIRIIGQERLGGATIDVMGDRIEAATYLTAGALTRGSVTVRGISGDSLSGFLNVLYQAGCDVLCTDDRVMVSSNRRLKAVSFETAPFPGVATDVQPLLMAALTAAEGTSVVRETVFENRFGHVHEYRKFGADISIKKDSATICGVEMLKGAAGDGGDIRAAAGLVILGCAARGISAIYDIHHLDRGYDSLVEKFRALGGEMTRIPAFDGKEVIYGC